MVKLPYYFVKELPLIFLLVRYFKFSPQYSGSISGPPFRCRKFSGPPHQISHPPPPLLVIFECSLKVEANLGVALCPLTLKLARGGGGFVEPPLGFF